MSAVKESLSVPPYWGKSELGVTDGCWDGWIVGGAVVGGAVVGGVVVVGGAVMLGVAAWPHAAISSETTIMQLTASQRIRLVIVASLIA